MHVSRGVNNNFLLLQRITWGRAVLHWGSVKPAWRTSSQWFSSSSTSSWRQWQGSWSTRPSLTFWTKSTTPSCLSPTKKWTCFLLQVGMKKTHTGPWLFLCVRPLPLTVLIVTGIALYLGGAQLLNCRHHFHHDIPPLVDPGKPQEGDCMIQQVTYYGPFTNQTEVSRHNHLPLSFFFQTFLKVLGSAHPLLIDLLLFLFHRPKLWWSVVLLMSETKSWSSCSSVATQHKRTSAASPTCFSLSLVTWLRGNCHPLR